MRKNFLLSALVMLSLTSTSAWATIFDYQSFAQSYADTVVQYSFDGTNPLANKTTGSDGTYDLVEMTNLSTPQAGEEISYVTGFDGTSSAYVPFCRENQYGIALQTGNVLPLNGNAATYEAILRVTGSFSTTVAYGVASRASDDGPRSYFSMLYGADMIAIAGSSFTGGQTTILTPELNDWYYTAVTMSHDVDTDKTTITTYYANLSDEDPTLSSGVTNVVDGTFVTDTRYGIGALSYSYNNMSLGGSDGIFPGEFDQVTFYNGVQQTSLLEDNLERILATANVPEPSTAMLLLSALTGLMFVRRR